MYDSWRYSQPGIPHVRIVLLHMMGLQQGTDVDFNVGGCVLLFKVKLERMLELRWKMDEERVEVGIYMVIT